MVIKFHSQESRSLLEVSRKDLVNKSRIQDRRKFQRRLNYQVSNFRGVDLEQLFEHDYFVFKTPIKDYVCTVAFPGVFSSLQNVVKSTHGDPKKINLQMVIKALRVAFDATDDVKVDCTCPDFWYRYSYVATQNGYKYGEPQKIPAPITNPDDDIGSTCKHLSLLLSNKQWVVKAASVVNSFIKAYPDKAALYLYDEDEIVKDDEVEDEIDVVDPTEIEETPDEEITDETETPEDETGTSDVDEVDNEVPEDSGDEDNSSTTSRHTPKKTNQKKVNRKIAKKSRRYNRNKESVDLEMNRGEDMVLKICESAEYSVEFNQLPTSEQIDLMLEYWDTLPGSSGSFTGFIKYCDRQGVGTSNVSNDKVNEIWDLAAEYSGEDDDVDEPIIADGQEIYDSSDAKRWLDKKIQKYGNTYHFPSSVRMTLDRLIDKFGNTYFWGRS